MVPLVARLQHGLASAARQGEVSFWQVVARTAFFPSLQFYAAPQMDKNAPVQKGASYSPYTIFARV